MNTLITALIKGVINLLREYADLWDSIWATKAQAVRPASTVNIQAATDLDSDDEPFQPIIAEDDTEDFVMQLYIMDMLDDPEPPHFDSTNVDDWQDFA